MFRLSTHLSATLFSALLVTSSMAQAEQPASQQANPSAVSSSQVTLSTSTVVATPSKDPIDPSQPKMLADKDLTRYLVCGFLHREGSYKIGSYVMTEYPIQWTMHHAEYQALVENKLTEISQQQNVSKFKAEDTLYDKYSCGQAYAELLEIDPNKI
ncbi:hypothetical protein HC723_12435 [Vibrio sp. S11_S32]|uniref:hypothetical protein n=1 Tax=Vibrio sp. S11_S32 TaxID=2720225 RepID=UPI00168009A1|nr:hypothetical protein [Vibrio sp. S11_S32]MBD1577237.1 hypothetical protein [Vibrio sp. S11_S32]